MSTILASINQRERQPWSRPSLQRISPGFPSTSSRVPARPPIRPQEDRARAEISRGLPSVLLSGSPIRTAWCHQSGNGKLRPPALRRKAEQIAARSPEGKHQKSRQKNNVQALHQLTKLAAEIKLPPGEHVKVTQKALMEREGVTISVRPEFITYDKQLNTFALTKFRFSNSPVSADAAETGLALLLEFAKEPRFSGHLLDLEHTMIIDVFSGTVIRGHTVGRHRLAELDAALRELATIWPDIKPPGQRHRPSPNGPGG